MGWRAPARLLHRWPPRARDRCRCLPLPGACEPAPGARRARCRRAGPRIRSGAGYVADAVEALGQDVDEEAADELMRAERHGGVAAWPLDPVVLDLEGDARRIGGDQAAVGDGDAVGVARQVGED